MLLPYLALAFLILATIYSAIVSFRETEGGPRWIFPDRAKGWGRIFICAVTLILVIGLGTWISTGSRNSNRRSLRFLIPEGYSGWVRVEFEVATAPPLPSDGGYTLVRIPPSGLLKTSSPEDYGWAKDDYFFYSGDDVRAIPDSGSGRLIWGKINAEEANSSGKRKYEEFFVGTEQQFKEQAPGAKSKDDDKKSNSPSTTSPSTTQ